MWKKRSLWIPLVMLLGMVGGLRAAEPFSLLPTFDGHVGNDAQTGPTVSATTGTGMEARNIATRRRVAYVVYDISGIKKAGQLFQNVRFSNYGHDVGTVDVYGVLESQEHLVTTGMTWNNAPGVKNDPTPPLDTDVVLDLADVTGILLTFDAPARGTRASTETSQAVADFLNSDTNGSVAFMFAPRGSASAIVRTVEMGADGGTRLEGEVGGFAVAARDPNPADEEVDVFRDVVLSWTPGALAAGHNVYFGTSLTDVTAASVVNPLGVLVGLGQDANIYDPDGHLAFDQTYYWRVDEVNAPPDATVHEGSVWSFTVEPFARRIEGIVATASSADAGAGPENTVNGSGLDENNGHSTLDKAMWLSAKGGPQPTWIQYEFDRACKLHEMWVWNYNIAIEPAVGLGFQDVTVEYSLDGTDWTVLGDHVFEQGTGQDAYTHNTTVSFGGVAARFVRLTARSNWGGLLNQYGLSEVQFFYIPTHPEVPEPASGAMDVEVDALLSWRAGREAAVHEVSLSTEEGAVADGTAPATTVSESRYDPGPLDLGRTYFWKVNEVNEAETPAAWEGAVWSFSTREYLVVDDFESYNDEENQGTRIYETWIDGYADQSSGSIVGHFDPPFAEQTIVHGGAQSMPLDYNNVNAPFYSEAQRTWDTPQDWSAHGADTLMLYFRGHAIGFLESAGTMTMSGTGTDIWGTADQFHFAAKRLSGNGTIIAKVESIDNTDPWAKAGVMIRESLEPGARFAAVYATPGNGVRFQARLVNTGEATSDTTVATAEQMALQAPVWIKLERTGNSLSGFYSTNGTNWTSMSWNPQTMTVGGTIYIGLVVTSHVAGVTATGVFSNVTVTGGTGAWEQAAIGVAQPANGPGQLYLAVRDSAGHRAVVKHSDPQAVLLDTWQPWSIPLADLQSAGVNVTAVKTLYLGVDGRDNPAQAGAGTLYIDDIGVGHPAAGSP
jgi:hypothetical protein